MTIFDTLLKLYGNRYIATIQFSNIARELAEATNNVLSHSEAINALLTSKLPKLHTPEQVTANRKSVIINYVLDTTSIISNNEVRASIVNSVLKSIDANNLVYKYNKSLNPYDCIRVRIWCRLIYDNLICGGT